MKIFAIKEKSSDNSETVVYGWLTYFEEEKEFQIRLCEEIDYWECPIFFSTFVKKGAEPGCNRGFFPGNGRTYR